MRVENHILKLLAIAALIASLLPVGAKVWWGFELATHFRVHYVVLDVLLLVALGLRRQWLWSAALAACAAWSVLWVAPYIPFGPSGGGGREPTVDGSTVKLMSANVLFRNHSAKRLLEIVRDESPDVLLLVEYTPEWSRMSDELRRTYPYHLEGPGTGAFGIALFSRLPLDSVRPFALGTTTAIEAHVRTPTGPLTLFGVHLRSPTTPRRGEYRDRQLDLLEELLAAETGPVAVMGDFNITPYSPFYTDWLAKTGLTDTRRARTLSPSWPTYLPLLGIPIDHCAVSRDVTILAHRSLPSFGSDHYPILAELSLPAPRAALTHASSSP